MAKDNILLITTDQQRFDTLNAWGNQSIFTPHLNYMAAMGISYKNCYASCPICVPSRTTIMTGRQGYESGVVSNATHETFMRACTEERSTLPAVLTDAGYQTCAKGKMHFEPARAHYGFEHMKLPLDYMREYDKKQVLAHPKAHGVGECEVEPVISTVEVKDSITSWIAEEAIDFLETRDTTRPFFLWTSFTKPHPPFDPCRDFWELYDNIPMPDAVTGDWSRTVEETPQGFLAGSYENTNQHLFGKEQRAASKRAYYACITQIDYALGRIFGCLRENDLFKNTWIIFTADHGEMLGDHHMSQKNLFFEGSAHVPLLIMPPQGRSLPQNISVEAPTDLVDLYPTILAMAGLSSPVSVSGRNLLEPVPMDRIFFGNSLNRNFCVMEEKVKLVYSAVGDHVLLFDLNTDPMEQHNLAEDPAWQERKAKLWKLLLEHTAQYTPEALGENGQFLTYEAPHFPGDVPGRWFGFHYHDYSVDTFH